MGIAQPKGNLSIKEYLEIESNSEFKYEYHDGEIFAMAGGTISHSLITGHIFRRIANELENKKSKCKTLNSDAKIFIKALNVFVYPDTSVVCQKIEESESGHGICNPILIVEVLSKSTEAYDRGDKFSKYRKIPSLQEYILIDQEKAQIDVFFNAPETDLWKISSYEGLGSSLRLESIGLSIPMSEIYSDVLEV